MLPCIDLAHVGQRLSDGFLPAGRDGFVFALAMNTRLMYSSLRRVPLW